ncbi:hypothetical protein N9C06_01815 [Salibacteraceae bacterium]|jgi:hypothetical protein|nr:hypothetical protein [Salibacteraceae bacterium]
MKHFLNAPSMKRIALRSLPLLLVFFALAPIGMASGSPIVFDFVSDIALGSMFEVDPLSKEAYAQANESLPKILYLITLQFAVLLSLFFYRVSRVSGSS